MAWKETLMHAIFVPALLGYALAIASAQAAERGRPDTGTPPTVVRTGKERLGDKASDEQRVDDCKVLPNRRTRARPTACQSAGGG